MAGTGLVVIYGQSKSLVGIFPITDPLYLVWLRTGDTCGNPCGSEKPPMATRCNQPPEKTPWNLTFDVVSLETP